MTPEERAKGLARKASVKSLNGLLELPGMDQYSDKEAARIRERLSTMPESFRLTYMEAITSNSLAAAIKAQCSECMGWDRESVKNCTSPACSLYSRRPYQKGA